MASGAARPTSQSLIAALGLIAHPEGGYFVETFRDARRVQLKSSAAEKAEEQAGPCRSASTGILFLVPQGQVSHLHRLASSEVWHYHMGLPLVVVEISPGGVLTETTMSHRVDLGHKLQHTVPPGNWFGAYVQDKSPNGGEEDGGFDFALVGCTVAPGFEFEDFELGTAEQLEALFPEHKAIVQKMAASSKKEDE